MKTLQLLLATVISFSLSFTACKKNDNNTPASETTYAAHEEMNVSYGSHLRNKMDVYFPDKYSSTTPVVFLMHGGGFIFGSKEDFTARAQIFKAQGFIVVNLNYRLIDTIGLLSVPPVHMASSVKVSDQLADVNAAVEKFKSMSGEWHAGTSKMYMAGHSAGAILSLLYTQGDYNDNMQIKACGNWAGLTDFTIPHDSLLEDIDPRYLELLYRATGAIPSTANNLAFMAVSPYWVANVNGGRPTITIYPENNIVLNLEGEAAWGLASTQNYHALLKNKGINERLSIYAGDDHGFSKPGSWDKLIKETADFFRNN
jgi:acetyl esterase/lipase